MSFSKRTWAQLLAIVVLLFATAGIASADPVSGAIFTTDFGCTGVNVNLFAAKGDVYLDGGPQKLGAAGLPDGNYFVKVTEPDGTLLGQSAGADAMVVNGAFVQCYNLFALTGFADTANPGGVYKVWVSKNPDFPPAESKTDNFKVQADVVPVTLNVIKFYDANANGINDGEVLLTGWKVRIQNGIDIDRYTPVSVQVAPGDYNVSEYMPLESNWMRTAPASQPVMVTVPPSTTVEFGNLCLGAGGGKTLGFWSNKNGGSYIGADDLALLRSLNLRNANGSDFDPILVKPFQTWLLSANATNMANMLSAQMAAMQLNVYNKLVNGSALIYAPGTTSANALGFATVNAVLAEANAELGVNGLTLAGHPARAYQEALKNALDKANNNMNFVQPTACPYTFAD
jgi:hypothetical protein